eukprot:5418526-Pleurochrysis_carterae.AAC.1
MTSSSAAVTLVPAAVVLAPSAALVHRCRAISSSMRWLAGLNSGGKTTGGNTEQRPSFMLR